MRQAIDGQLKFCAESIGFFCKLNEKKQIFNSKMIERVPIALQILQPRECFHPAKPPNTSQLLNY